MNNLLSLRRLFRLTGFVTSGVLLLVLCLTNSCFVVAADNLIEAFPPGIDEGDLGLEIIDGGDHDNDLILPSANPSNKPFVYADHKIRVLSKYRIGYDLSVIATTDGEDGIDNRVMHGQTMNSVIRSTNDGMLANNSWGITTVSPDAESTNWRGFNDGSVQVLLKNRGELSQSDTPDISETDVYYGVKIDYSTLADTYSTAVKYTLSQQIPDTPAVIKLDRLEYAIGDDDTDNRTVHLTGVRFDMVAGVGVDFNGDGEINDGEGCTDWLRENGNSTNDATCNLPVFDFQHVNSTNVPGADEMGGVFNLLLKDDTSRIVPSGHQITYRYQPRIDSVEVLNSDGNDTLVIKDSVGIVDMVSTDSASMVLTDDGDVYLWGNTPLYDGNQKIFDKTMAPMVVKFPDLTHTDSIIDIAGYGKSYYAISHQGYLYAWGDNSARQLPLQDSHVSWFAQPAASSYYGPKQTGYKRFARQITAGNQFGATLNTPESGQLMSSWGRNDLKQLGQDDTNTTFVPGAVVQDSKYRPVVGESYVDIIAGKAHVLALTSYGRVLSWGAHGEASGGDNRLGFKTEDNAGHPHDITYDDDDKDKNYLRTAYRDEDKTFIDIAAGDNFSMALAQGQEGDDKTYLYTFGANDMGQLGNGGGTNEHRAYEITNKFALVDGEQIIGITASGKSAAAWTNNGRVYVWGDNTNGCLGVVGGVIINTPTQVLAGYSIDGIVLGAVNYAHTTAGRVISWGGNYGSGFLTGANGDITDWLTHPTYLIKVTGRYLNLLATDIWVDFNDDGVMNEAEQPLVKVCDSTSCYLQISTIGVGDGDIDPNGYSVRAITAGGTNHAGMGNDNIKLNVTRKLARNTARVAVEKPIIKRQAKSNDVDDGSEAEVSSIEDVDEAADTAVDRVSSGDDMGGADDTDNTSDVQADVNDDGNSSGGVGDNNSGTDKDDGLDESNDDNNTAQSGCESTANDDCHSASECVERVDDEQCEYVCICDSDVGANHDSSKTAGACMRTEDDLSADGFLTDGYVAKNLAGGLGGSAQIQLVDGCRKGCIDGVSGINVDD